MIASSVYDIPPGQDLPRTFPSNVWLGGTRDAQLALERVLLAYSMHNPSVG
jgi:Rab-GTPase-TBC domain